MKKFKTNVSQLNRSFVLDPSENYRGLPYGEIIARWNRWLMGPDPDHDNGEEFLFLRGNIGHSENRRSIYRPPVMTISEGIAITVPIVTTLYCIGDYYEGALIRNEHELIRAINMHVTAAGPFWATIQNLDGTNQQTMKIVQNLEDYRFQSPFFDLDISSSNPFLDCMDVPVSPGRRQALAGGYFLLVIDLPASLYRIKFGGKGYNNFHTSSVYDIRILHDGLDTVNDISEIAANLGSISTPQRYPKKSRKDTS